MAELIQDSTPVKKFSLSNPYQDRNPGAKVAATRRGARRPRAAARTEQANDTKTAPVKEKTPPPKELAKEPSAHAIIEATLPPVRFLFSTIPWQSLSRNFREANDLAHRPIYPQQNLPPVKRNQWMRMKIRCVKIRRVQANGLNQHLDQLL